MKYTVEKLIKELQKIEETRPNLEIYLASDMEWNGFNKFEGDLSITYFDENEMSAIHPDDYKEMKKGGYFLADINEVLILG